MPLQWALLPLRRYANFSDRAPRPEFWWFHLLTIAIAIVAGIFDYFLFPDLRVDDLFGPASMLLGAALFLPWWAALVRRLHDTGKSGWYVLVIIVPYIGVGALIWMASRPGFPDANAFGDDPYGRTFATGLIEPTVRAPARS